MKKAHDKMTKSYDKSRLRGNRSTGSNLQYRLDHYVQAQPALVKEEHVKAVAVAIQAQKVIAKHMCFANERRHMKKAMRTAR